MRVEIGAPAGSSAAPNGSEARLFVGEVAFGIPIGAIRRQTCARGGANTDSAPSCQPRVRHTGDRYWRIEQPALLPSSSAAGGK